MRNSKSYTREREKGSAKMQMPKEFAANSDAQSRPKGIYRRFIFTGTPEQKDKLASLISNTGLTREDLALILSTLQLNSAAFGETSIHQPNTPTHQPDTPTA